MTEATPQADITLFLASSVHDMKNSLGLLGGMVEKLVVGLPPHSGADRADYAHMLYELKRINDNLMHLLTVYKLGNALYPFDPVPTLIADLYADLAVQNRVLFSTRQLALQIDVPADLTGYFDVDLIAGVIGHALVNAANYTRDTVRLSARELGGALELRVEDNGRGYPPAMLLDSRAGLTGVDFFSGSTGLGLYFAHEVARLHCNREHIGSLRLENGGTFGGGCFVLTLP
ncbi:MAG TPA: HAMP domain-containing sensor histidine kinase [Chitinolyticbacter sp.]|nr:HAMP domain-containing sensor histidine kinase [Chitinolyticbacter sp.]